MVALVGLYLSSSHWLEDSLQTRISRDLDRMQRSFQQLGQQSPHERLAGVLGLSSFLSSQTQEHRSQVLVGLSNALAIEESESVRRAIVSSFQNIDTQVVSQSELDGTVLSLAQVSRGLMTEGDLWLKRSSNPFNPPRDGSPEARARAVADATVILLRKGAHPKNLSNTYLAACSFAGLDLSGVDFDDSIVAWSDFSRATLVAASFDGADLDSTNFEQADLRKAHLTNTLLPGWQERQDYVSRGFGRALVPGSMQIRGPDFNCADLREADFNGHTLFALFPNGLNPITALQILPASFVSANIENTDFRFAKAYGVVRDQDPQYPPFLGSYQHVEFGGMKAVVVKFSERSNASGFDNFSDSLQTTSMAFAGTKWQSARFTNPMLQEAFKRFPPSTTPTFIIVSPCTPR
jgi:uncharacterized protein YjbI with pentapeptide repeats